MILFRFFLSEENVPHQEESVLGDFASPQDTALSFTGETPSALKGEEASYEYIIDDWYIRSRE
jgi:hypothetical protein